MVRKRIKKYNTHKLSYIFIQEKFVGCVLRLEWKKSWDTIAKQTLVILKRAIEENGRKPGQIIEMPSL